MTISIRMTPEMRDELQALADKEERTLSWFCMKVLRDYLRAQKKAAGKAGGQPTAKAATKE